ncbi:uroporphyrinogen decarboxylase [Apibacter muscae]|uniref:Uroporphyrinogen decarboxylase n=1 Tax=Apibacter muscae TaxID=2509004 RepID=A0A563DGP4_9FLAO|nr:uroporphyrinogen decarboxylase [Apibacter muscae]TWP29004.1 uroporphyrinogen decarboxylase [Apibacter muscae]
MIKNTLFLDALKGKEVQRPPVWMMRQAGRFLPEFRAMRDQYDFFTRCQTPELAAEITLMPIQRFPLDAAILFSDILVIPQAMGMPFEMKESVGPFLANPIASKEDVDRLQNAPVEESLDYVFKAISITKELLKNEIPLIGFAGSPWTIFCYAVEGKGSKTFDRAKAFAFKNTELAHILLQKITDYTIEYLLKKVEYGVDAVQIFDSWGGLLSPKDYEEFSWKYINQIVEALAEKAPVIVFGKGCWFALDAMSKSKASALGVDWTITPQKAREFSGGRITLQGNFDPAKLLLSPQKIYDEAQQMVREFGVRNYIANLGHGILPNIPLENAASFVKAIVEYKA